MTKLPEMTLAELVDELDRRERTDPLAEVYTPTAKQQELHACRAPVTIVMGANRAGKSFGMIADALYTCLHRPVYAELPPAPVVVWYVVPSLGMYRRAIHPILMKLLPHESVRAFAMVPHPIFSFTNGSSLYVLSADMRQKRLAAAAVDQVYMDESPDEAAYDELLARLMSTRGRIILGFLPDQASGWVDTRLVTPYEAGDVRDVHVITMPIADEATGKSLVPWFTDKDIETFKRKWPDPAVQAARIYGRRVKQAGMVFKQYDAAIHQVAPFDIPQNWMRFLVCDASYYRFLCLWFAVDEAGNYVVTDEFFSQEATLRQRVERMGAVTAMRGAVARDRQLPVYVDSQAAQDIAELNWHFGETETPLGALKLPFRKAEGPGKTPTESWLLRVHSLLEPDVDRPYPSVMQPEGETIYGAPRLFFFDTLYSVWELPDGQQMRGSRLLWEIARYTFGKDGRPDKKSADGGDACDALLYGCNVLTEGAEARDTDSWKRKLQPADVLIWERVHRWSTHVASGRDY
jgi:phage terminase large subunit-like protein